jgi:Right handed beta helix region
MDPGGVLEILSNTRGEVTMRTSFRTLSLITVLLALLGSSHGVIAATTYYVATNGNDANPGTLALPWRTFAKGLSILRAGDKLLIRGGVYEEAINTDSVNFPNGTSWTNAITLAARAGEHVVLRPRIRGSVFDFVGGPTHHVIIDGLVMDAIHTTATDAVSISEGSHHIRFQNCEIKNAWGNGVGIWSGNNNGLSSDHNEFVNCHIHHIGRKDEAGSPDVPPGRGRGHGFYITTSHNIIDRCLIHDTGEYGVHIFSVEGLTRPVNGNIVRSTTVTRVGFNTGRFDHRNAFGIIIGSGTGNIAYNNVIFGNFSTDARDTLGGIQVAYNGAQNNMVYNNTIYGNGPAPGILIGADALFTRMHNNIVYRNTLGITDLGSGTARSNNLLRAPLKIHCFRVEGLDSM